MLQRTSLGFIRPMLPTLVDEPPAGDNWLHEIKHDGFRTQLVLANCSERYGFVLEDAARLNYSSAEIDGEPTRYYGRHASPERGWRAGFAW
jgi:ATP-dependent DNA ligase